MITLDQVTVKRRGQAVLVNASLQLRPGEVLAIVGPNGAGKSTLMAAMAGDLAPSTGHVLLDGIALNAWTPLALARRRAVMPQAARLGFSLPVEQVVALGRAPFERHYDRAQNQAAIRHAIAAADIQHLLRRGYATLSGGEQQRVQLARAVAQLDLLAAGQAGPAPILMLDEPTASLDLSHAHAVLRLARQLAGQGVAVATVLHDLPLAYAYADRVAVLQSGRLLALDTPLKALTPENLAAAFAVDAALYDGHLVIKGPLAA